MEEILNTSFKIKFVLNTQREQKDGNSRAYLKLSIRNEIPKFIPLPFSWPIKNFNKKEQEFLPRFEGDNECLTYQTIAETRKAKYWRIVKRFLLNDKNFTLYDILKGVKVSEKGKYIGAYIKMRARERELNKEIKYSTQKGHRSIGTRLIKNMKGDQLITDIGKSWLEKYLLFLMKTVSYSSAWAHIKTIRTYIFDAEENGIEINETFHEFLLENPEYEPVWLEREELYKLLNLYRDENIVDENRYYLKIFLFACFTGLRVGDLKRFHIDWIKNNELIFAPQKVRLTQRKVNLVYVPIIPMARQFLVDIASGKIMERSEQKFNKRLKVIASLAGIDKNLTTHVARHTFGTLLAVEGTPALVIMKLMGHKKIETTMKYIHIAEAARQNEMLKLQNSFNTFNLNQGNPHQVKVIA